MGKFADIIPSIKALETYSIVITQDNTTEEYSQSIRCTANIRLTNGIALQVNADIADLLTKDQQTALKQLLTALAEDAAADITAKEA